MQSQSRDSAETSNAVLQELTSSDLDSWHLVTAGHYDTPIRFPIATTDSTSANRERVELQGVYAPSCDATDLPSTQRRYSMGKTERKHSCCSSQAHAASATREDSHKSKYGERALAYTMLNSECRDTGTNSDLPRRDREDILYWHVTAHHDLRLRRVQLHRCSVSRRQ